MAPDVLDIIMKKLDDMDGRLFDLVERVSRVEEKLNSVTGEVDSEKQEAKDRPRNTLFWLSGIASLIITLLNLILFLASHFH